MKPLVRIMQLERERDELRAVNLRLRDKLLELAKECSECGGTGMTTVPDAMQPAFGRTLPCPDCEDIRQCLE